MRLEQAVAEPFAAGRFGRRQREVECFASDEFGDRMRVGRATRGERTVAIEGVGAARAPGDERVDQHVCRPRIPGNCVLRAAVAPQHRDVRDPAEVERDDVAFGRREQLRVDVRYERRTISPERAVRPAKIENHAGPERIAQAIRISDLHRLR